MKMIDIAKHLDMSERNLRGVLNKLGLTKEDGLDRIRTEYIRSLRSYAAGWQGDEKDELRNERIRETKAKADKLELEICEKAGELVPMEAVLELQRERELAAKTSLMGIPARIQLHYQSEYKIEPTDKDKAMLNNEMDSVLRHMRGGEETD